MSSEGRIAPWKASIAGMVAHTVSCSMHPFENIKLRFQAVDHATNNPIPPYKGIADAFKTIYRTEGFLALYRGVLINIVAGSVANSIFFSVYQYGKRIYNFDSNNPKSWKTIAISMQAGVIAQVVTMPLWVVKTRLALYREGTKPGLTIRVIKDMAVNEGPHSFFKGLSPSLFLSLYGIIQMYSYENINYIFGFNSS
jgi:hypothetical protein